MGSRRTTQLLAAAVLTLTLAGCGAEEDAADSPGPAAAESASPSASDTPTPPTSETTGLTVDSGADSGRCMVPTAEALADQPIAFEGTVTDLQDGTATLRVDRWYAGGESEEVTVAAPDESLRALLAAVELETGKTYLVSAHERGRVTLCGFTAEKTPQLEAMYAEAFAP